MTDQTAVGVHVALNAGFHAAWARLKILVEDGTLPRASEVAYGEGIAGLVEFAGPAAGLIRLADVFLEDLTETDDCAHIALQWEALAADGKLFTALLAGRLGGAGAGLGQAIVRRCATAIIGSFLDSVAYELVPPAGMAGLLAGQ